MSPCLLGRGGHFFNGFLTRTPPAKDQSYREGQRGVMDSQSRVPCQRYGEGIDRDSVGGIAHSCRLCRLGPRRGNHRQKEQDPAQDEGGGRGAPGGECGQERVARNAGTVQK